MDADLFSARDAAALRAIAHLLAQGRLSREALRAVFTAAGLMRETDETVLLPARAPEDARTGGPAKRAA